MLAGILFGAQVAGSLFQHAHATRAADRMVAEQRAAARYRGLTERADAKRMAKVQGRELTREFQETVAAQRASLAHAGVQGGRTAQLIRARSEADLSRGKARTRGDRAATVAASRHTEKTAKRSAMIQGSQMRAQAGVDLLGGIGGLVPGMRELVDARRAQRIGTQALAQDEWGGVSQARL